MIMFNVDSLEIVSNDYYALSNSYVYVENDYYDPDTSGICHVYFCFETIQTFQILFIIQLPLFANKVLGRVHLHK